MKHLSEEQLILLHYGEGDDVEQAEAHLALCKSCRNNYELLQSALDCLDQAPIPERGPEYGREVWARLQPRLTPATGKRLGWSHAWRPRWRWLRRVATRRRPDGAPDPVNTGAGWWTWAVGGCAILLLSASALFLMAHRESRFSPKHVFNSPTAAEKAQPSKEPPPSPAPSVAPEHEFLRQIGHHLELSQLALAEVVNSHTNTPVDISSEQKLARELVVVNRRYCGRATRLGDLGVAAVLEDLDSALTEMSNGPSSLSSAQLSEFRRRVDGDAVLCRARVVSTQLRAQEERERGS